MKLLIHRPLVLALATSLVLSGCATTGGGPGSAGGSGDGKCNPWATGAMGALVGAALGAGHNKEAAAKGAIAGAAIAALSCLAINASSRQTQTAETVQAEYRQANAGVLPSVPTVLAYDTSIYPGNRVAAGQSVEIKSNLKLVDGTQQRISSVREDMILLGTDGREIKRVGKDVSSNLSGGGYENTFSFSFPSGVSQGVYGVRTELLVNGQVVGQNDEGLQLVIDYHPATYPVAVR